MGGFGSVRGYQSNTIGPHSTPAVGYVIVPSINAGGSASNPVYVYCDAVTSTHSCTVGSLETAVLDDAEGSPFGGNVQVAGSAEIIFPMPFVKDQRSLQSTFFIDGGSAFDTNCGSTQLNCFSPDLAELRYSYGLGLTWITGIGPLTFSIAKPIGSGDFDKTQFFQFALGQSF